MLYGLAMNVGAFVLTVGALATLALVGAVVVLVVLPMAARTQARFRHFTRSQINQSRRASLDASPISAATKKALKGHYRD